MPRCYKSLAKQLISAGRFTVFDEERNRALTWDMDGASPAWPVFQAFSRLCDEDLLKNAWSLRKATDIDRRGGEIVALLMALLERSGASDLDPGLKRLFDTALGFGIRIPHALDLGSSDGKILGPNVVVFLFVLSSMARRLREAKRKGALSIKADRPSEFNASQAGVHELLMQGFAEFAALRRKERCRFLLLGCGIGERDISGAPPVICPLFYSLNSHTRAQPSPYGHNRTKPRR